MARNPIRSASATRTFLLIKILGGPLGKIGQQHRGLFAAAGELLAQHLPGLALHFKRRDGFAGHVGHDALSRAAQADAGADAARNQRDHHGRANNQQHAAENNFLGRPRGLQKSNHVLLTPEY